MTHSAIYPGVVRHTRLRPFRHELEYRVYYGLFDLDELTDLSGRLRLFGFNKRSLFSLWDRDHGGTGSMRRWVNDHLQRAGIDPEGGSVRLLAFPRVLGYVFNPISVWFCYDRDENLRAVLHEVSNTFRESHSYLVPVGGDLSHSFDKELFVSPFIGMEGTYRFRIRPPGDKVSVAIRQFEDEEELLRASFVGERLELTDRNLLRVFFRYPLVTLKVIAGIHWEALKLWRKGARYRRRPAPPSHEVTIVGPALHR